MKSWYFNGKKVRRPDSLYLNGCTYVPPTDEQLTEFGYEMIEEEDFVEEGIEQPVEEEVVETPKKTYEQRVVELIRLHYSVDDELAILRQRDTKTEEFEEYNSYCENCKTIARVEFGLQEVKEVPVTEEPIENIVEPIEE